MAQRQPNIGTTSRVCWASPNPATPPYARFSLFSKQIICCFFNKFRVFFNCMQKIQSSLGVRNEYNKLYLQLISSPWYCVTAEKFSVCVSYLNVYMVKLILPLKHTYNLYNQIPADGLPTKEHYFI